MQFRPLHDRVLVRRIEAKEKFGEGRRQDLCA
jgi:co-chaperonin GroES (HSP10)